MRASRWGESCADAIGRGLAVARYKNVGGWCTVVAEVEAFVPELNKILGLVEQLGEVDTSGVAPLAAVIPNNQRLRDDVVTDGDIRDRVLKNAPQAEHGFFAVPKVIE